MLDSRYRSETIGHLMAAFAKAQGTYKPLKPNESAPGGSFANLKAILDAVRQSLADNELGFYQYIELLDEGSGASILVSVLGHSSGEWISSRARLIRGQTERATGTLLEIKKRHEARTLLGISAGDQDPHGYDDDGIADTDNYTIEQIKKPDVAKIEIPAYKETVSKEQYEDLMIELNGHPDIIKNMQEVFKIDTLADLPKTEYHKALQRIRQIKRVEENYQKRR